MSPAVTRALSRFVPLGQSTPRDDDPTLVFLADCATPTASDAAPVARLGAAIAGHLGPLEAGTSALPARDGAGWFAVHPDGRVVEVHLPRQAAAQRAPGGAPFPDAVFVYGTLMRGEEREGALRAQLPGVDPRPGRVDGQLVHLGAWPGLLTGTGDVTGELYPVDSAEQMASVLAVLDPIEDFAGYAAAATEYVRVVLPVRTEDGVRWAWAYRYVGSGPRSEPIPSGRWRDAPRRLAWWRDT